MAPCHSFTHKASSSWKVIGFWVTSFLSLCLLIPQILRILKCSRFIIRWFALGRDFPGSGSVYKTYDSGGECGVAYESYFQMPTPATDKPWYSIESGPVHFTVMSTENNWTAGSEQASRWKVFTWDRFVLSKFINVATTSFEIIWPLTLAILQYNWIQSDLASVNRSSTPWLIFTGYVVLLETTPMSFFQKLCSQFEEQEIQQQLVLELLELVEIPYRGSMQASVGTLPLCLLIYLTMTNTVEHQELFFLHILLQLDINAARVSDVGLHVSTTLLIKGLKRYYFLLICRHRPAYSSYQNSIIDDITGTAVDTSFPLAIEPLLLNAKVMLLFHPDIGFMILAFHSVQPLNCIHIYEQLALQGKLCQFWAQICVLKNTTKIFKHDYWYKKIMKKEDLESRDRSDILRVDDFGNMLQCRLIWQSGDMSTTMSVLVLSTRASA